MRTGRWLTSYQIEFKDPNKLKQKFQSTNPITGETKEFYKVYEEQKKYQSMSFKKDYDNKNNITNNSKSLRIGRIDTNNKISQINHSELKSKNYMKVPSNNSMQSNAYSSLVQIKVKGLPNIGLTCYMNSVLQCLFHLEALTTIISKMSLNEITHPISYAFQRVIEYLKESPQQNTYSYYNSYGNRRPSSLDLFQSAISKCSLFRSFTPCDSKDLVIFLLENMHNELNENRNRQYKPGLIDQKNEWQTLSDVFNRFFTENKSVFIDLFYGFTETNFLCLNCGTYTYNFQIFDFVDVPLLQLVNFKNSYNLRIEDYFFMSMQNKVTDPNNLMYCQSCAKETFTQSLDIFYSLPNILVISLNYGKNAMVKANLDFDERLDLSNYIFNPYSPKEYSLRGVICHRGSSNSAGHYVAYCKHFDNKWYCFDDNNVLDASFSDCKKGGNLPYVLFFEKIY